MRLQTKADYAMLWMILTEAEARVEACAKDLPDVALRSSETVALCEERMEIEGLTRKSLKKLAGAR